MKDEILKNVNPAQQLKTPLQILCDGTSGVAYENRPCTGEENKASCTSNQTKAQPVPPAFDQHSQCFHPAADTLGANFIPISNILL